MSKIDLLMSKRGLLQMQTQPMNTLANLTYAYVSKETYYKAKETYYKAKETYYKAKETYYKAKETY